MDEFYTDDVDEMVADFTDSIKNSIKQEFLDRLERLQKENAELSTIKSHMHELENDYAKKNREMQDALAVEKKRLQSIPLTSLMELASKPVYGVTCNYAQPPKCPVCDDNRKIPFVSVDGRKVMGPCICSKGKNVSSPVELNVFSFRSDVDGYQEITFEEALFDNKTKKVFKRVDNILDTLDNGFEALGQHTVHFRTKEEAQAYCDWLNAREEVK